MDRLALSPPPTWTVALARWALYGAAALLFGAPAFRLLAPGRGRGEPRLPGGVIRAAALLGGLAAAALLGLETVMMAGGVPAALTPSILGLIVLGTPFGIASVVRLALTAAILAILPHVGRAPYGRAVLCALGALVLASLAWDGHAAADDGPWGWAHLAADVVHLLCAGLWLGALAMLAVLALRRPSAPAEVDELAADLAGYAGTGAATVALLVASGVVNVAFLVGPAGLGGVPGSPWGQLLLTKLALVVMMLALAGANRFVLTRRLRAGRGLAAVRASLLLEGLLGLAVLWVVSWLGLTAPAP